MRWRPRVWTGRTNGSVWCGSAEHHLKTTVQPAPFHHASGALWASLRRMWWQSYCVVFLIKWPPIVFVRVWVNAWKKCLQRSLDQSAEWTWWSWCFSGLISSICLLICSHRRVSVLQFESLCTLLQRRRVELSEELNVCRWFNVQFVFSL